MIKKPHFLKIAMLISTLLIIFLFVAGYKLGYKKDIEKIDTKILNAR